MSSDQLGQLPESDRADELEELSLRALQNALPVERFRLRSEPGKDRGVDQYLEAKLDGRDTNCRSQLQLKGQDSAKENQDGSISRSVAVANLNYLCFGPSPIYVLYVAPTQQLRFVWAGEEVQRLDRDSPDWRNQKTVTLRFSRVLEDEAIGEVHSRMLREARFKREVHEIIARSTLAESVSIQINADTLKVSDPNRARQILLDGGMTIAASGFAKQAVQMFDSLNPCDKCIAKLQLVRAYAQYFLDDYCAAQSSLSQAAKKADDLSDDDRRWLERLRRVCDYRIGRMDRETYLLLERQAADKLTGLPSLEHRLEVARHSHIAERDLARRQELKREIQQIVCEIRKHPETSQNLRIAARIAEVYAEGQECVLQSVPWEHIARMRDQMGGGLNAEATHQERSAQQERWDSWARTMKDAYDEAVAANHPILIADALYTSGGVRCVACLHERAMEVLTGRAVEGFEERVRTVIDFLERAQEIYRRTGGIENELRAAMGRVDLHEALGEADTARRLAEQVLHQATAMQFVIIEQNARDHLEGRSLLRQLSERLACVQSIDEDVKLAAASDSQLEELARDTVTAAGMSRDRTEAVLRHYMSRRAIARQRLQWCRHIDLDSDFSDVRCVDDLFARDPEQICVCQKLGTRSAIPCRDWAVVLRAFKENHCQGCESQDPKEVSQ